MEFFSPPGISYSDNSTDDLISATPYGPDSCFNPDPRSPRHIINRGKQASACILQKRASHRVSREEARLQQGQDFSWQVYQVRSEREGLVFLFVSSLLDPCQVF